MIVHAYDDILGLGPWPKLIAQTMAVIIILGPWIDGTFHGILLFTFNNPFGVEHFTPNLPWYREPTLFLVVQNSDIALAAIPAILFTWFWTVGMMNTVNWIDGMDGLATGVVGITALFITLISFMLQQYSIAVLSAIFTGAVFGFLPHNWNPAKIFMGDTGSMFLGLALAVLSLLPVLWGSYNFWFAGAQFLRYTCSTLLQIHRDRTGNTHNVRINYLGRLSPAPAWSAYQVGRSRHITKG